ncbi:MAG TPA: GatB/YqeY domain-containing protein [Bauldia sp.]|nr:GatB/YqeY domain-containing protein [Bauldia sp.]
MIRDDINEAVKAAMKSGDRARLSTLRMVTSAIKNAEIDARTSGREIGDEAVLSLLQKLVKQRQESAGLYEKGGRGELAAQERAEIAVIQSFLPQQMGEAEMAAAIDRAVAETGAAGVKDMGKVIGALKAAHAGRMDFAKAGQMVRARLGG